MIFVLLYDRGSFMLSRNFRLQAVGSLDWVLHHYDFGVISRGLDEVMVLDVSRGDRDPGAFATTVQEISKRCFIPTTVGGGIKNTDTARLYMESGADKLLIGSAFDSDPEMCARLAQRYGRQCLMGCVDYVSTSDGTRTVLVDQGTRHLSITLTEWISTVVEIGAGEVVLQAIDRDGTGMGLGAAVIEETDSLPDVPLILMGGVGRAEHIVGGLQHPSVDAVATANLFNFVGDTFLQVRQAALDAGVDIPTWDAEGFTSLRSIFAAHG